MDKKLVIKAIKRGVSARRIAKEIGIPHRTLLWKIEHDKELTHAKNYYETWVDNLFCG